MPQFPSFSRVPTTDEITKVRIFEEPLIPTWWEPWPEENAALADALTRFAARKRNDDFSALTDFLVSWVSLSWRASLQFALGWEYYHTGYYSKAIDVWEEAWLWLQDETGPAGRRLADRCVGELARMHARIGGADRLEQILDSIKDRRIAGSASECVAGAKQALWLMRNQPEVSFRCGPLALRSIGRELGIKADLNEIVFASASTKDGFSLVQLEELAVRMGIAAQIVHREPRAEIPAPSVVHWKVGHYAALVRRDGDRFLMVDPTFGDSRWISAEAVEAESSGYFIAPIGRTALGWRAASLTEKQAIFGKGVTGNSNPNNTTPSDRKAEDPRSCLGMAVANAHLFLVSLNIEDTPLFFVPPRGPPMEFRVTYNSREANQPAGFTYANFGHKWTCNWISYIRDNGPGTPADVDYYVPGGGTEVYTGFNTNTQAFAIQWRNQTVLVRLSTDAYEMRFPDGSRRIFAQPDGSVGNSRKVFLTHVIDPTGYTNILNYDPYLRLANVTDPAAGKTNFTFYYNVHPLGIPTFSIQKVTDRHGRSAFFGYRGLFSDLETITDVIGITSKVFYASSLVSKLQTPYGDTTFSYGDDGKARWLEITNPQGAVSRVEYNQSAETSVPGSDLGPLVPSAMRTRNLILYGRNTFYWDRKAWREAPGDYSKARIYHWLHSDATLTGAVGVLESYKEPLESRVWFNYPGQTTSGSATIAGSSSLPTIIGRVLDDGTQQFYQYYRNSLGKITNAIDPIGREFTFVYATNEIDLTEIRQTRAANNELLASFTYNAQHLPLTATDAAGQTTHFAYNSFGQLTGITNALSETTLLNYETSGLLLSIDGPLAGTSDSTWFAFDEFDRLRFIQNPDGFWVDSDYDDFDRPIGNYFPDGTTQTLTYKLLDPDTFTDRRGRTTRFVYNSVRQLAEIHEATNWITRLDWCKCGQLESIIDPLGQVTRWLYDIQGRPTAKLFPDGNRISYGYETNTSRIKLVTNERGQTATNLYDYDDSLLRVTYANPAITPTVTYYYDTNYRLTAMQDGVGVTFFNYYPITGSALLGAGRLQSVNGPYANDTIAYLYDALGRMVRQSITNTTLATNAFDNRLGFDVLGRITAETNRIGNFAFTYAGASARPLSTLYPNNAKTIFGYHGLSGDLRLKDVTNSTPAGNLISRYAYGYDRIGQITNWVQERTGISAQTFQLNYNAVDQLTDGTVLVGGTTNQTYGYAYDLAGNRLSERIGTNTWRAWFNPLNQLLGKDSGGPSVTNRTFDWDQESRLVGIWYNYDPGVGNSNVYTQIKYNALGHWVELLFKTNGVVGETRQFTWSGDRLVQEFRFFTNNTGLYIWFYELGEQTTANGGVTVYYARDHLGSVRNLLQTNGSAFNHFDFDPYGRRTVSDTNLYRPSAGFGGLYTLTSQNLNLAEFRAYEPDLGRWISRDPIGEAGGFNLYRYCFNDPINWVDPDGLCPAGAGNGPRGGGGAGPPRPPRVANAASPAGGDGPGPSRSNAAKGRSMWEASTASRGFKSFDDLKKVLGSPGEGNQWHHIVEQNAFNINKFGPNAIHNVDNVIPISAQLNSKLNAFYQTKNPLTGGLSPREWLQRKTLQQNYDFGRVALEYVSRGIW